MAVRLPPSTASAPTRGSTTSGTGCTPASRATCGSLRRTRSSINSPLNVPFRASSHLRRAWRRPSCTRRARAIPGRCRRQRADRAGHAGGASARSAHWDDSWPPALWPTSLICQSGSGRFGSQIPAAVALFRAKWDPRAIQVSRERRTRSPAVRENRIVHNER